MLFRSDDDLTVIEGKREQLVGKIQERYGYAKDQAEKEVDSWDKRHNHRVITSSCPCVQGSTLPLLSAR